MAFRRVRDYYFLDCPMVKGLWSQLHEFRVQELVTEGTKSQERENSFSSSRKSGIKAGSSQTSLLAESVVEEQSREQNNKLNRESRTLQSVEDCHRFAVQLEEDLRKSRQFEHLNYRIDLVLKNWEALLQNFCVSAKEDFQYDPSGLLVHASNHVPIIMAKYVASLPDRLQALDNGKLVFCTLRRCRFELCSNQTECFIFHATLECTTKLQVLTAQKNSLLVEVFGEGSAGHLSEAGVRKAQSKALIDSAELLGFFESTSTRGVEVKPIFIS